MSLGPGSGPYGNAAHKYTSDPGPRSSYGRTVRPDLSPAYAAQPYSSPKARIQERHDAVKARMSGKYHPGEGTIPVKVRCWEVYDSR